MTQSVLEFWQEDLNNLRVTRGKYEQMQASEDTTSLKSLRQYLKASNRCAVKFMHVKSSALCWRTASIQKLHTGYLENLKAYDQQRINLHQKYSYLLGQARNTDETPVISYMLTNTTTHTKGAKQYLSAKWGKKNWVSVLVDGHNCYSEEEETSKVDFLLELYLNTIRKSRRQKTTKANG